MSKIKRVWIPVTGFVEEVDDPFDDRIYFHLNNGRVISMHPYVKKGEVKEIIIEACGMDDKEIGESKG